MKNILKLMTGTIFAGLTLTACSPEDFKGADQNDLPTMEGVDFTLDVDQTVNQIKATVPVTNGLYPVWIIDGATYSTLPEVNWSNKKAGTYSIELHMANRNGVSQAGIIKSFTFEKSLVNWTSYYDRMNGKEWRIDNSVQGHLGCGEPGTSGTNWWSANKDDKADWGVYDDRITFSFANSGDDNGTYTYDPGEGGTMYVNTGCKNVFPADNTNDGNDYMANVQPQSTTFKLESGTWTNSEGNIEECVYIVFPAHTQFPYISADAQWEEPRFRIESVSANTINLVYDGNGINWHFTLTSKAPGGDEPATFNGYKYDSDGNLWKNMAYTNEQYYAHGDGWEANANPIGIESTNGNQSFKISLPDESNQQWQAQAKFLTNMVTNASTNYDFSAKFTATQDIKGATVKLVLHGDDNTFYFADRIDLVGGETYVFYKDNMAGIDMNAVDLVLDFGGAPAGTEVELFDIVLKDHAFNDGAGHPEEIADNAPYSYDDENNVWKTIDASDCEMTFFYTDASWTEYPEKPGFVHDGNQYTVTLPNATEAQWQAQVAFHTNLSCKKGDKFDFGMLINPSNDLKAVTIKLVKNGGGDNDKIFFFEKKVDLVAGEDNVIKFPAQVSPDDMDRIALFFDFGGNPANTEIVMKNIVLKKSAE